MDIKSLSFYHVYWVQKLFKYYFQIDYSQDKAKNAADPLFYFYQRSYNKKEKL